MREALEPDDEVLAHVHYQPHQRNEPFEMAITRRAVVVLRKKRFAVRHPYVFETIPLVDVLRLEVRRLRTAWWYVLAAVLIVLGAYTTWGMFTEDYRRNGGRLSGWPIAALVGGLVLPLAARGRYALILVLRHSSFVWKPAMVIGAAARRKQMEILSGLAEAARSAGVMVRDERPDW